MGWNIQPPKITKFMSKNEFEPADTLSSLSLNKQIVVVSFFGPSQFTLTPPTCGTGFKKAFQLAIDAFGSLDLTTKWKSSSSNNGSSESSHENQQSKKNFTTISGFYNEEETLLILCLDGAYDPNVFLSAFKRSGPGNSLMSLWSELNSSYCQALLLLFSLSHVMILCNVGSYFDTSYIMLFRALDRLRHEMNHEIRDALSGIEGLPEAWVEQCRLCSPRLLFFFPVENLETSKYSTTNRSKENDAMGKLKVKLETEIYQILRKCRIITNVSGHSLFAVPMDQDADFVFLYDEGVEKRSNLSEYIKTFCETSNERLSSGTGLPPRSADGNPTTNKGSYQPTHRDFVRRFRSFLLSHVKLALGKGFEDNAHHVDDRKYAFLLPKLGDWMSGFKKLKNVLLPEGQSQGLEYSHSEVLRKLPRYLDIDAEYLEAQCSRAFHKVFSVYTKNIPSHYSAEEQRRRVNQAIDAFLRVSRSPGIVPWLEKLTDKCDRFWKRGRQQCSTLSLHRHLCINPCHRIEPGDHLELLQNTILDESFPEMKHSTGNRLTSYCNCGRRSGTRDEPFTIREANYDFYRRLSLDCCEKLDGWKVPVFEDDRGDEKGEGLTLEEMLRIFLQKKKDPEEEEERPLSQSQVLERELRQEEEEEEEGGDLEYQEDRDDFEPPEEVPSGNQGPDPESGMGLSQEEIPSALPALPLPEIGPSACALAGDGGREYLPGMLHSRCPPDLLPLFPSWSLLRLGNSSIYAHNAGIQYQPGFLAGTGYLLPWDVRVKAEAGVSKPVPRVIRGRIPGKQVKRFEEEFNVKVFIGFEYECRKGHRFMLESPDKVLQITNPNFGPSIREAATRAASSDMPLYFKCLCNTQVTGEQTYGQLMRIHVVTPKAPVYVTLHPRVQPAHGSPYFLVGNKSPINLAPSVYWILRLPYAYVTEEQIYTPPTEKDGYSGRISRGLLDVISMSRSETLRWESNNRSTT